MSVRRKIVRDLIFLRLIKRPLAPNILLFPAPVQHPRLPEQESVEQPERKSGEEHNHKRAGAGDVAEHVYRSHSQNECGGEQECPSFIAGTESGSAFPAAEYDLHTRYPEKRNGNPVPASRAIEMPG